MERYNPLVLGHVEERGKTNRGQTIYGLTRAGALYAASVADYFVSHGYTQGSFARNDGLTRDGWMFTNR